MSIYLCNHCAVVAVNADTSACDEHCSEHYVPVDMYVDVEPVNHGTYVECWDCGQVCLGDMYPVTALDV